MQLLLYSSTGIRRQNGGGWCDGGGGSRNNQLIFNTWKQNMSPVNNYFNVG